MCAHTQRRGHRRRTCVHREGVNVSTNAMWSTCVREFPTHTGGSRCQEAPVLTLHAHAYTCPHRLAPRTRAKGRHVQTWEHVCEQGHTGSHADDPQVCVCSAVPWCPSLHPLLHAHSCPKGLGTGYQSPLWLVPPILPSPCSFQLDLSPEADLGISVPCF